MKKQEVIDKFEKEFSGELRKCRYCGSGASQNTIEDINFSGHKGWKSTIRCNGCLVSVAGFGDSKKEAEVMARSYWQRGILEGVKI